MFLVGMLTITLWCCGHVQVYISYTEGHRFQRALAELLDMDSRAQPGAIMEALVQLVNSCSALMAQRVPEAGGEVRTAREVPLPGAGRTGMSGRQPSERDCWQVPPTSAVPSNAQPAAPHMLVEETAAPMAAAGQTRPEPAGGGTGCQKRHTPAAAGTALPSSRVFLVYEQLVLWGVYTSVVDVVNLHC